MPEVDVRFSLELTKALVRDRYPQREYTKSEANLIAEGYSMDESALLLQKIWRGWKSRNAAKEDRVVTNWINDEVLSFAAPKHLVIRCKKPQLQEEQPPSENNARAKARVRSQQRRETIHRHATAFFSHMNSYIHGDDLRENRSISASSPNSKHSSGQIVTTKVHQPLLITGAKSLRLVASRCWFMFP